MHEGHESCVSHGTITDSFSCAFLRDKRRISTSQAQTIKAVSLIKSWNYCFAFSRPDGLFPESRIWGSPSEEAREQKNKGAGIPLRAWAAEHWTSCSYFLESHDVYLAVLGFPGVQHCFPSLSFVLRISILCLTLDFGNNLLISTHVEMERHPTMSLTHEPSIGTGGLSAIQPMCYHSVDWGVRKRLIV